MAKFARKAKQSAKQQAKSVSIKLNKSIKSVGTSRNYQEQLKQVASWIKEQSIPVRHLSELTKEQAVSYLEFRGQQVSQSTLDLERQSIQAMMLHVSQALAEKETLPRVKSELSQARKSRFYEKSQASTVSSGQNAKNSLSTQLAYAAGLRAHELLTLRTKSERTADDRPENDSKWQGRQGVIYTVTGKGGLVREVLIPTDLANELESYRLERPTRVTDRNIHYELTYDIAGGKNWSNSFSSASKRKLGWSRGAHGLRHSYAQERMRELRKLGYSRKISLETVSQEMGHFRPEITEVYLR